MQNSNILVIGNGFDLHHGMRTKYADLLQFYINYRDNNLHFKLNEEESDTIHEWTNNSFFDYLVSEYEDRADVKNWIDMEQVIKQYVKTLVEFFRSKNSFIGKEWKNAKAEPIIHLQNHTTEVANILINAHALGEITKNTIKIKKEFISFQGKYDIEAMIDAFSSELNGLEKIVSFYLEIIEPKNRVRDEDYHSYSQIQNIDPKYVICFNYTNTMETFYHIEDNKICYIHGNLNNHNVVLGYEDLDQNGEDIVFKKFYRRIIKHTKNTENERLYDIENGAFLKRRIVHFFGHSLDRSDEDILKPLLEKHDSVIYYYNDSDYAKKIKNLFLLLDKETVLDHINKGKIRFELIKKGISM